MGKLHIGMSLAPTWLSGEAWRRTDSGIENYHEIEFLADIATRAEAAKMDFVFLPDTLYLDPQVLETGPGFSSMDPTMTLAAIAHRTQHIGLLSTVSTTFLPPYVVARQLQTLNRISRGRAGWNVVTALGGHENFGLDTMPAAEERYARAAEFVDVVRALWQSYPDAAILNDRATGRYADASLVRSIDRDGDRFRVKGPLNLPAWPGDRIPLIQAGASEAGQEFAAAISDAIFASTPDRDAAAALRASLRARAVRQGRTADEIRLLPGLSLYLADSRAEARDLYQATHARADHTRATARIRAMIGLDLSDWPEDRPITAADLPSLPQQTPSRTHAELLQRIIRRDSPLLRDLLTRPEVMGSGHWQIVGTVQDAADEVAQWAQAGTIDGFICVPGGSVRSMRLAIEGMVPALVDRNLFRSEYKATSFLGHLMDV